MVLHFQLSQGSKNFVITDEGLSIHSFYKNRPFAANVQIKFPYVTLKHWHCVSHVVLSNEVLCFSITIAVALSSSSGALSFCLAFPDSTAGRV